MCFGLVGKITRKTVRHCLGPCPLALFSVLQVGLGCLRDLFLNLFYELPELLVVWIALLWKLAAVLGHFCCFLKGHTVGRAVAWANR